MDVSVHGPMLDGGACGICAKIVGAFPIGFWADGPVRKTTAAIRTDIVQDVLDAGPAKCAFKRANHRVRRTGRKRCIAVLAIRS